MMVTVTFVIPAYNAAPTIDRCLRSILAQTTNGAGIEFEIIVVDNGSTDATVAISASHSVLLLVEPNPGAASARNRGINASRGELIALIDADCELPPSWTLRAIELLERHRNDNVCAVGGPGRLPAESSFARCMNGLHYGVDPVRGSRFVRSLATMNVLFRGSVLRQHGFDASYHMGEDPDLNLRLVRAGYRLLFDPCLAVVHYHPTSLCGILRKWYTYGVHYPTPYLRRGRLLFDRGFLPRLLYLPLLLALLALSPISRAIQIAAVIWIVALPLAYFAIGLPKVRGFDRVVFPLLHSAKQWAQMTGMIVGIVVPRRRGRRIRNATPISDVVEHEP